MTGGQETPAAHDNHTSATTTAPPASLLLSRFLPTGMVVLPPLVCYNSLIQAEYGFYCFFFDILNGLSIDGCRQFPPRFGKSFRSSEGCVAYMAIRKNPPTQRALNALETKNTIFNTALSLFSKYGFDNVTVDKITGSAGFAKGTFYTHFNSKESILVEQFHMIDNHYDEVFRAVPETVSAGERLLILIRAMTHYCVDICGVEVLRIVYANQISASRTAKILDNKDRRIYFYLNDIAARGKRSGEFQCSLPDGELAELLMRFCRSLIYDWCLYGDSFNLNEEGQRFFRQILSRLAVPGASPSL